MERQEQDRLNTAVFPRFGECSYLDSEVIEFPWGLPGFASLRHFLVLQVGGQDGFIWLQSLDDVQIALPLADPWQIFDDYEPHLPHYAKVALALDRPDDFIILCIVVVTKNAEDMTMNLLAPIIINLKTHIGRQIMLEGTEYSIRTPIPRKAAAKYEVDEAAQPDSQEGAVSQP